VNLDRADKATGKGFEMICMAESGNIESPLPGSLQDARTFFDTHGLVIDSYGN
jgi:hypothetical protein